MTAQSVTIVGNLTGAPELRFGGNGTAVASFSVASTDRYFDKKTSEYVDGNTHFQRCVAFGPIAENLAASLNRGSRVVVFGTLVTDKYDHTDKETGEKSQRSSVQLRVDEVAASLRFAEVKIVRTERGATLSAPSGTSSDEPWQSGPVTTSTEPPF